MVDYKKLVESALSQIGYEEPNHDNHQKYGHEIDTLWPTWYNGKKDGFDWCTQFVDWNFLNTFGYDTAKALLCRPDKNYGAVVKYAYNYFNNKKQTGSVPKVGAVIYFQNSKGLSHTGIVVAYDETTVTTVEGNSGKGNYFVVKNVYKRTSTYIYGYGYPDYDNVGPQPGPEPGPKTLDGYTVGELYEVICRENLNVRTAATVDSVKVTSLPKGTQIVAKALTRDTSQNTWMRIEGKVSGWICCIWKGDKYVGIPKEPQTLDGYTVGGTYTVIARAGLNVRTGPGTSYGKTSFMPYGTKVTATKLSRDTKGNTWICTSRGWIAGKYEGDVYVK